MNGRIARLTDVRSDSPCSVGVLVVDGEALGPADPLDGRPCWERVLDTVGELPLQPEEVEGIRLFCVAGACRVSSWPGDGRVVMMGLAA